MAAPGRAELAPLPLVPLVSIVTPSFNQAAFIEETIESVLAQDYPHIEYLVIDGGSTDGTLAILRRYADRLSWVSERDAGQADAINKGWRRARGEILAWLNSDDLYEPGAVRRAVAALQASPPVAAVYGDCAHIDQAGHVIGRFPAAPWDYRQVVLRAAGIAPQQSAFFRREALEALGYLDASLRMVMDADLWLRFGLSYTARYLPVRMARFRMHGESKTVAMGAAFGPELLGVYERLFARPDLPEAIRRLQRPARARITRMAANYALMAGNLDQARRYAWQSWQAAPLQLNRTLLKIAALALIGREAWYAYHRVRGWLVPRVPFLNP